MPTGVVKYYRDDRGFGFIKRDAGGADVFVHIHCRDDGVESLKSVNGCVSRNGLASTQKSQKRLQSNFCDAPSTWLIDLPAHL